MPQLKSPIRTHVDSHNGSRRDSGLVLQERDVTIISQLARWDGLSTRLLAAFQTPSNQWHSALAASDGMTADPLAAASRSFQRRLTNLSRAVEVGSSTPLVEWSGPWYSVPATARATAHGIARTNSPWIPARQVPSGPRRHRALLAAQVGLQFSRYFHGASLQVFSRVELTSGNPDVPTNIDPRDANENSYEVKTWRSPDLVAYEHATGSFIAVHVLTDIPNVTELRRQVRASEARRQFVPYWLVAATPTIRSRVSSMVRPLNAANVRVLEMLPFGSGLDEVRLSGQTSDPTHKVDMASAFEDLNRLLSSVSIAPR